MRINTLCWCGLLLVILLLAASESLPQDLSHNGNCEQVENGKPVGWGPYSSGVTWSTLEEGYRGRCMWFTPGPFTAIESGDRAGENYINTGIVHGSSYGMSGRDALVHHPSDEARYFKRGSSDAYKVSFWIKSECNKLNVFLQGWTTEEATAADRAGSSLISHIGLHDDWTYYEAIASPQAGVRKFAVVFQVWGYEKDGLQLGRVCIDELKIERVTGLNADSMERVVIPDDPAVFVGETPLEEILEAYRREEEWAVTQVQTTLKNADTWAAHSDEWYRQFYGDFEPRGIYTVACPIHPFETRYYNDFQWSIDEPWRLVCRHCREEGRKYDYYPNPDYPDNGHGCAPTDEVWARDHDQAWSRGHRGIPHDHWNGSTNGYMESRRYYFKGKYYANVMRRLEGQIGPELALAWHYADRLFPAGSEQHQRARLYAHKAKVILVTSARAYLGDDYLAAAEGISSEQFQARMCEFYRPSDSDNWQYEKLSGFRMFDVYDRTEGDPVWDGVSLSDPRIYPGTWNWRAQIAGDLLELLCRARASFGPGEEDILRISQRPVVSIAADREKLAMGQDPPAFYMKRGVFEHQIHPFNLDSGGDNLIGQTMPPKVRCGMFLRDERIMELIARDLTYFFRNYFSEDGLGQEGSPTYSAYGAAGVGQLLYGFKGDFDTDAPYYDRELGGLNLARLPWYIHAACKYPYYVTDDDDHFISWEDSVYGAIRSTRELIRIEKYGGGIPEEHRKYYDIHCTPDGEVGVTFNRSVLLPSLLLHDRRKAILRAGRPSEPTVVSLDYTNRCGHYHRAVQSLMIHACGQELASDLGYLGSTHHLTTKWIQTHPAHNCLTFRKADGNPHGTESLRGDLRRHFIVTPVCQIVDSAEYDQADWTDAGEERVGELSRTVLLMTPDEQNQYVVDIVRGQGSDIHEYYLHCHGLGFDTEDVELQPVADADQNLYDYSGWSFRADSGYGAKNITELLAGKSTGAWQATWSRVDDYRGQPAGKPLIHEDVFMRLWMLDMPGSEVIVGTAPAQRYLKNEDYDRAMKVLCVRRPNRSDAVDIFAGVIEPYRNAPFVRRVRQLALDCDDGYTVGIVVETEYGTDYIVSYGGPSEPSEISFDDAGHTISTDSDVAVISYTNEGRMSLLVAGGSYVEADGFRLTLDGPPELRGRLMDFDDDDDTLIVESEAIFPLGDVMAGLPIIVQHSEDRSTYTIGSVEALDQGRYRVRLDGHPHLVDNWLLVKHVDEGGISVEPPPVLDSKTRAYKVYAGPPEALRMCGPLRGIGGTTIYDESGMQMYSLRKILTDDYTAVQPGEEIGITRLEKGVDTVLVTNYACISDVASK